MSEERTSFNRGTRFETWVQHDNLNAVEYRIAELELQIEDAEVGREFLRKVQGMANVEIERIRAAMENQESYNGPRYCKSIAIQPKAEK